MNGRTKQITVRFSSALELPGFDEPQSAEDFRVDQDDEQIEGNSWLACWHVGIFIHMLTTSTHGLIRQMIPI